MKKQTSKSMVVTLMLFCMSMLAHAEDSSEPSDISPEHFSAVNQVVQSCNNSVEWETCKARAKLKLEQRNKRPLRMIIGCLMESAELSNKQCSEATRALKGITKGRRRK